MKRIICLTALTHLLVMPTVARADILYGMDQGILTKIDTDTLTATPIGDTGYFALAGLEFGPDGQLYGLSYQTDELVKIDLNSGSATVVGSTILNISSGSGLGLDPTTNLMYATAKLTLSTPDILVIISLETGGVTYVGEVSGTGSSALHSLDFTASGELYGIQLIGSDGQLRAIDKTDGTSVPIGSRSLPTVGSLTIAPSGTAWTIEAPGYLYSIDLENGTPTNHGLVTGFTGGEGLIGSLASIPSPPVTAVFCAGILLSVGRKRMGGPS